MNRPANCLYALAILFYSEASLADGTILLHSSPPESEISRSQAIGELLEQVLGRWKVSRETESYVVLLSDPFDYGFDNAFCGRLRLVISLTEAVDPALNLFPLSKDELFALRPSGLNSCEDVDSEDFFEVGFEPGTKRRSLELMVEVVKAVRVGSNFSKFEFTSDQARNCLTNDAEAMRVAELTSRDIEEGLEVTVGLKGCRSIRPTDWIFISTVDLDEATEAMPPFIVWKATAQTH
jgi:hypothetical protein